MNVVFGIIGITFIFLYATIASVKSQKKYYNGGVCIKCGKKLRYIGNDTDGDRNYCCDECGFKTKVSHYFIDEKHKE